MNQCAKCRGDGVLCVFCGKPPGNLKSDCNCSIETLQAGEAEHVDCLVECVGCEGSGEALT